MIAASLCPADCPARRHNHHLQRLVRGSRAAIRIQKQPMRHAVLGLPGSHRKTASIVVGFRAPTCTESLIARTADVRRHFLEELYVISCPCASRTVTRTAWNSRRPVRCDSSIRHAMRRAGARGPRPERSIASPLDNGCRLLLNGLALQGPAIPPRLPKPLARNRVLDTHPAREPAQTLHKSLDAARRPRRICRLLFLEVHEELDAPRVRSPTRRVRLCTPDHPHPPPPAVAGSASSGAHTVLLGTDQNLGHVPHRQSARVGQRPHIFAITSRSGPRATVTRCTGTSSNAHYSQGDQSPGRVQYAALPSACNLGPRPRRPAHRPA